MDRRDFVKLGAAISGTLVAARAAGQALPSQARPLPAKPGPFPGGQVRVVTPNGATLPMKEKDGLKIGHLVAMPVDHTFAPGLEGACWGYNGRVHGPTIEVVEGDRARFYVTNRLPEPTTVHWHGIILPNGMDGVAGLTQRPIMPRETHMYEFTFDKPGTFMYHPHFDEMTQMALGMVGMIVVHPKKPKGPRVDRDFALITHEWAIRAGMRRPDPNEMKDFNVLTFNAKAFPGTEPLVVGKGERVRIRLGNLSAMDHHPIHLHGLSFEVVGTDGGDIPVSARVPETTVLVPTGSVRVIEFVPTESGDWAMHCHMTHHIMNQMGHGMGVIVGANAAKIDARVQQLVPGYMTMGHTGMGDMAEMKMPAPKNSIPMVGGKGPFSSIDMGGMFTILKVRDNPESEDGSGWYSHPKGSVADKADAAMMQADGVDPDVKF
ncbi:MAG: copper oxidase [Polyangiaceae bacterium]|nr:copper oxidase [Polyangiaceae bacterium]